MHVWQIDALANPWPVPRALSTAPSRTPVDAPLICKVFFTARLVASEPEITAKNYEKFCIESMFISCYQIHITIIKSMLKAFSINLVPNF